MPNEAGDSADIKETDIVFDCPHCGKSLAIDYRGAGLSIPCTDCGEHVEVPIPEGMELTDIDSSEEDQEVRILTLRRLLHKAEAKIEKLETELEGLDLRRTGLEKSRAENIQVANLISDKIGVIREAIEAMSAAVKTISSRESTEK